MHEKWFGQDREKRTLLGVVPLSILDPQKLVSKGIYKKSTITKYFTTEMHMKNYLQWSGKPVATMTIRTFSADKNVFKKKIDDFFRQIADKEPAGIVIDLNYNGGGEEELAAYLMSHLIDKPTRFLQSEYLIDTSTE